jgi:hypothetical protein
MAATSAGAAASGVAVRAKYCAAIRSYGARVSALGSITTGRYRRVATQAWCITDRRSDRPTREQAS